MRTAQCLRRRAGGAKPLPGLLFFTDPDRTPDPVTIARGLPRGSAVVYRSFGAPEAERVALALKAVAREKGLKLLIGADESLARRVGADGLHLPERMAGRASRLRARNPGWILTAAAHNGRAMRAPGLDAVVVSAIFPSRSASAGRPMGPVQLAGLIRRDSICPVYGLGGITDKTARRMIPTGVVGLAGIDGFRT